MTCYGICYTIDTTLWPFCSQAKEVLKKVQGEYLSKLMNVVIEDVDGTDQTVQLDPPKCLPWWAIIILVFCLWYSFVAKAYTFAAQFPISPTIVLSLCRNYSRIFFFFMYVNERVNGFHFCLVLLPTQSIFSCCYIEALYCKEEAMTPCW